MAEQSCSKNLFIRTQYSWFFNFCIKPKQLVAALDGIAIAIYFDGIQFSYFSDFCLFLRTKLWAPLSARDLVAALLVHHW